MADDIESKFDKASGFMSDLNKKIVENKLREEGYIVTYDSNGEIDKEAVIEHAMAMKENSMLTNN